MLKSENNPLPLLLFNNLTDILQFKVYRAGSNSNNIVINTNVGTPSKIYGFLPQSIPQGVNPTTYVINTKNNFVQNVNTVDFKINIAGTYKYTLNMEAYSDVNGVFGIDLVNGNNTEYNSNIISIKNITTSNTIFNLQNIINHNKDDVIKIRFGGVKFGGGDITINISKLDLIIEKI